jgi:predicted dehydrogenase
MARYRVALIGLGRIASTIEDEVQGYSAILLPYGHMGSYREVPAVEVVAGADPYQEQRDAFRRRWGVEHVYADYREMLQQEQPDIVSVTTSAKPRPEIVIACAQAGVRAIFAEKPIALSLAEADAMIAACREHGTILAIGCTALWHPYWNKIRELIAAGAIGQVLQVNGFRRSGLSHNGSHLITLVNYLAGGNIRWVFGEMESDEKAAQDEDQMGNGYLAYDNGVRAFVRAWPNGPADLEYDIIGETGRFRVSASGQDVEWTELLKDSARAETVRRLFPRPQRIQSPGVRAVHDLVACLETGKEPNCTGEDARAALEIAIAMRESHRQGGRRIDLPLADRSLLIRSAETLAGDLPVALRRAKA